VPAFERDGKRRTRLGLEDFLFLLPPDEARNETLFEGGIAWGEGLRFKGKPCLAKEFRTVEHEGKKVKALIATFLEDGKTVDYYLTREQVDSELQRDPGAAKEFARIAQRERIEATRV
jgi:hypothetical protein